MVLAAYNRVPSAVDMYYSGFALQTWSELSISLRIIDFGCCSPAGALAELPTVDQKLAANPGSGWEKTTP